MKKRVIKLTETDLRRIVKRVMREDMGGMDDVHPIYGDKNFSKMSREEILNLDDMGSSEYSEDYDEDLENPDEYYGTFDDDYNVDKNNKTGNFDYEDFEEDEFADFDSYKKSRYGSDRKNRWDFNSPDEEMGRKMFKTYQERSGGKPFRVRRRK